MSAKARSLCLRCYQSLHAGLDAGVRREPDERIRGVQPHSECEKDLLFKFPGGWSGYRPAEKNERCALGVVDEVRPQFVFVNNQDDVNDDHRRLFDSTLVATRPINRYIKKVLSYSTFEFGQLRGPFTPNVYIDITGTFEVKIKAMESFVSEMRSYPHPRSPEIIRALAQKWGSEVGIPLAEAFKLIREVV